MLIRKTVSRVDPYHSEVICNEETGRAFNVQRVPFHYRQSRITDESLRFLENLLLETLHNARMLLVSGRFNKHGEEHSKSSLHFNVFLWSDSFFFFFFRSVEKIHEPSRD